MLVEHPKVSDFNSFSDSSISLCPMPNKESNPDSSVFRQVLQNFSSLMVMNLIAKGASGNQDTGSYNSPTAIWARIQEAKETASVVILDEGQSAVKKTKPKRKLVAILSGFIGLSLSICFVVKKLCYWINNYKTVYLIY